MTHCTQTSSGFCKQCPRECNVDRENGITGFCKAPQEFRIARVSLHQWEEPSISGTQGSGTIFFSGCNLRCVFCQNYELSHKTLGEPMTADQLAEQMLRLRDMGAHNINLVTPTPYTHQLASVLQSIKPQLGIPVVFNCGGYEKVEMLQSLEGLIDVYLPDIKFFDPRISQSYAGAADYFSVATDALEEMLRQIGPPQINEQGLMERGVIVRHLVLPGGRRDSVSLLNALAERFGTDAFLLSLMNQYTPEFALSCPYPELHRKVTTFEYQTVLNEAERLGFDGYIQSRSAATAAYTPDFYEKTF